MAYCSKCGSEVSEQDNFCSSCGALLSQSTHEGFQYAGFWRRLVASLIDGIILSGAGAIIGKLFGISSSIDPMAFYEYGYSVGYESDPNMVIFRIISALLAWLYYAAFESSSN